MRPGAEAQTEKGPRLSEPQASSSGTPDGLSTAGGYWGQTPISLRCIRAAPAGQATGSANSGSDPKNLSRHQGRLFLAHLILAKQKKVSRPPRRQSGIGTHQETRRLIQRKASIPQPERGALCPILRYLSPNGWVTDPERKDRIRKRAFSGSEHKFPSTLSRPSGAALRLAGKL